MADLVNLTINEEVVEVINIDGETVEITVLGAQGPPGAGVATPVNFAWGNATPQLLTTVPAGKRVYSVELVIEVAFNGVPGAMLSVGPLAATQELMGTTENNPASSASYETTPNKLYGSATAIYLHIIPGGGASAGSGQILLQIEL